MEGREKVMTQNDVGKSMNVYRRIEDHFQKDWWLSNRKPAEWKLLIKFCPPAELEHIEAMLITNLRPACNQALADAPSVTYASGDFKRYASTAEMRKKIKTQSQEETWTQWQNMLAKNQMEREKEKREAEEKADEELRREAAKFRLRGFS
jgi:hypothetical protein